MTIALTAAALFVVAVLYASVGHGGASGYLAVLALAGKEPETIRPLALSLNVLVSSIALMRFGGRGHFHWNLFWPFAVTAVPCAFLAGWQWTLPPGPYSILLALILLFAAWQLALPGSTPKNVSRGAPLRWALPAGAIIGILSGLIGVGGGIFLSPLLILAGWAAPRAAAAACAAFILVSSLGALAGLTLQYPMFPITLADLLSYGGAVIVGGFLGASLGVSRFNPLVLRRALAIVLMIAALKMLLAI
ncbi:MAG: sulfite exporter TauE/SafE family protein [Phycisphaerales bacterium]|nr:MAG: sulfite exporter TauE/SafE family protein [Phycisphaerales bacterium]